MAEGGLAERGAGPYPAVMRRLTLRTERLNDLSADELADVVGAAASLGLCPTVPDINHCYTLLC
jgi:hypothetical protein